jgi:hypothetical protein
MHRIPIPGHHPFGRSGWFNAMPFFFEDFRGRRGAGAHSVPDSRAQRHHPSSLF